MVAVVAWLSRFAAAVGCLTVIVSTQVFAAEEKAQPLLWQLDPRQRARVLMALLGLILAGVGLVALTILGGRYVLRLTRKQVGPTRSAGDAWAGKPLFPAPAGDSNSNDDNPGPSDPG